MTRAFRELLAYREVLLILIWRDLKTRYPELQGTLSDGAGPPAAAAAAPQPAVKPDAAPTGSILRPEPSRRMTSR